MVLSIFICRFYAGPPTAIAHYIGFTGVNCIIQSEALETSAIVHFFSRSPLIDLILNFLFKSYVLVRKIYERIPILRI